jgi:hypothetical protein
MARAVDDPVNPTVPVERLADERFEIPLFRNRAREAETPELPGQILGLARRRHEGNPVAPLRELPGGGGAVPLPAAVTTATFSLYRSLLICLLPLLPSPVKHTLLARSTRFRNAGLCTYPMGTTA